MTHTIDIVIPTKDRRPSLARCLWALTAQTFSDFRVIVVDDGSTPAVEQWLPDELRRRLHIHLVRNDRARGPASARNQGVAISDAPYIAFIDDDVRAEPHLLERYNEQAHRTEQAGEPIVLFGPLRAPANWRPTPWNDWEARQLAVEYGRMARSEYEPTWRQFHTGNAFLRRTDFLAAGGFDERFTRAEDIELGIRLSSLGRRFAFCPDAVGWHDAERSLAAWLSIPRAYARFDVLIDRVHPALRWATFVRREHRKRHPLLRVARALTDCSRTERPSVRLATSLATQLHRAGWIAPTMSLLSLAYDLEYHASLSAALAERATAPADPIAQPALGVPEASSL